MWPWLPKGRRGRTEAHIKVVAAAHADGDGVLADGLHQRRLVAGRHRLPGIQRDHPPAALMQECSGLLRLALSSYQHVG